MRLLSSQQAPNFSLTDYQGNNINLQEYAGKKVLLSFFRGAACPFCNLRVNQLINRYDEFVISEIQVLIFFAATGEEIFQYAGQQQAPFSIIPDPQEDIYKKYGIESSHSGMFKAMIQPFKMMSMMSSGFFNLKSMRDKPLIPADFLINRDQTIHQAYYGKDFGDHLSIDRILEWAK